MTERESDGERKTVYEHKYVCEGLSSCVNMYASVYICIYIDRALGITNMLPCTRACVCVCECICVCVGACVRACVC